MHAFEIQPVPYQVIPWVSPPPEHKPTNFRVTDSKSSSLSLQVMGSCHGLIGVCVCVAVSLQVVPDEFVVGQSRDWNEEMQSVRELPSDTAAARVFRDRAIFKVVVCSIIHAYSCIKQQHREFSGRC